MRIVVKPKKIINYPTLSSRERSLIATARGEEKLTLVPKELYEIVKKYSKVTSEAREELKEIGFVWTRGVSRTSFLNLRGLYEIGKLKILYIDYIYTYTFMETGESVEKEGKEGKEARLIEVHFEGKVSGEKYNMEFKDVIERVARLLVERAEYEFIYEEPNTASEPHSWEDVYVSKPKGKIKASFEIYDHNYDIMRGDTPWTARLDPDYYKEDAYGIAGEF